MTSMSRSDRQIVPRAAEPIANGSSAMEYLLLRKVETPSTCEPIAIF